MLSSYTRKRERGRRIRPQETKKAIEREKKQPKNKTVKCVTLDKKQKLAPMRGKIGGNKD